MLIISHSTQPTPDAEAPISLTDMEYMMLIIRGYASAYSIWTFMKDNPKEYPKPTAYKNINLRLIRLARIGLLKGEVKFDVPGSTHGRRDYEVTMEGLERLIPYLIDHSYEIQTVIEYIETIGLDTISFGLLLLKKYTSMTGLVHEYHKLVLSDISNVINEKGGDVYNIFVNAISNLYKDIGKVQQKQFVDRMTSAKLFDKKTNKIIADYYEEITSKLERYNIELNIDDKGKNTKKYTLTRSRSETHKKRDRELVGKDMRALLSVIYLVPEPVKFLKDITNNIEALVVLPPGELENYYNSKNKKYNLTKSVDN